MYKQLSREQRYAIYLGIQEGKSQKAIARQNNMNDNKLITLFDPNVITLEDFSLVGSKAYDLLHDLNFDGKVEWPGGEGTSVPATTDWNIVKRNRQKYSEVR